MSSPSAAEMLRITPLARRFDFHRRLVGLDLEDRRALGDGVAVLDIPLADLARGHVHVDTRQDHLDGHGRQVRPVTRLRTAATMIRRLRHRGLFEHRIIGDRRLGTAEPHDRRIEIVEGLALGDHRADLGADAQAS